MNIVNSDTNAVVAGIHVPYGTFEFPLHGGLGVLTSTGSSNYCEVGMSDTLFIFPGGASVASGPDVVAYMVAGLALSMLGFGVLGFARWLARRMGSLGRFEEI